MESLTYSKRLEISEDVLVIIPAYNEEPSTGKVVKNCRSFFNNILVVDDGSIDNTIGEAINAGATIALRHCDNCGQGTALATGIKYFLKQTKANYLITFDADEQHLIEDAYSMVLFAKQRANAVFGNRFTEKENRDKVPQVRKLILLIAVIFESIFFKIPLSDAHNGLRV